MASGRGRTKRERGGEERRGAAHFPEGRGQAAKRGDPPLEEPRGDRSRHGHTDERGGEEEP